jgi:hypothetical protein
MRSRPGYDLYDGLLYTRTDRMLRTGALLR